VVQELELVNKTIILTARFTYNLNFPDLYNLREPELHEHREDYTVLRGSSYTAICGLMYDENNPTLVLPYTNLPNWLTDAIAQAIIVIPEKIELVKLRLQELQDFLEQEIENYSEYMEPEDTSIQKIVDEMHKCIRELKNLEEQRARLPVMIISRKECKDDEEYEELTIAVRV